MVLPNLSTDKALSGIKYAVKPQYEQVLTPNKNKQKNHFPRFFFSRAPYIGFLGDLDLIRASCCIQKEMISETVWLLSGDQPLQVFMVFP